jgi:hypothetical protein
MVPNTSLFKPYLLNTDNWVQSIIDFGAVYSVLVGKVRIDSFEFEGSIVIYYLIAFLWFSYGSN